MRKIREIWFFSLLVLATLLVQNASATIVLPNSSFAQEQHNWQGDRVYEQDGFHVLIDFAVYDTQLLDPGTNPDESDLVDTLRSELDLPGQYIYAYQIFNAHGDYEEIGYFEIFGIGEPSLDVYADSIGALSDSDDPNTEGIEPTDKYFNPSQTRGTWLFSADYGPGSILSGEHSWFLVFSSDAMPVAGDYEIRAPEASDIPASTHAPEPGTLMLLGLGGALIFTRRRKSAQ